MKRRKFYWLVLIALILIMFFRSCEFGNYLSILESNWEYLSFPPDAGWQEVYSTDSGPSPHGDGWRYHVYSYKNGEEIPTMVSWTQEEGRTVFQKTYREACEEWLDVLEVPENQRPEYEACQVWYEVQLDNSQLLIFWNAKDQTFCIAENFI